MQEQKGSFTSAADRTAGRECEMLELGLLVERERARALSAFERLPPGGSLEIVTPGGGGRLVADLQVRYGPRFYWWPLERGPRVWRAILAKPALGTPVTVAALMDADHLRLWQLWGQFCRVVELCQTDSIHRRSGELLLGLRRYIDIEEAVLFPLLEAQTQMSVAGTTERMRSEHHEVARFADELAGLRTTFDCAAVLQIFDRPVEPMLLFERHCRREAAALYPVMDTVFSLAEQREMLLLLQAFEI